MANESGLIVTDGIGERLEGAVLVLALVNPARRNAFTPAMRSRLALRIAEACADDAVRAVVLTGEGGHFCAGADLSRVDGGQDSQPGPLAARDMLSGAHHLVRTIAGATLPVIAAVEGGAFGGGMSIALACDLIVAAQTARFGLAFARLGLMPDMGMMFTLSERVGRPRARRMIMGSETVTGADAVALGLADIAAPEGGALALAIAEGERLAVSAPLALGMVKLALAGRMETLEDALRAELDYMPTLTRSEDFAEGLRAFKEKRPARFKGR